MTTGGGRYPRFKDLQPHQREWIDDTLDRLDVPFNQRAEVKEFATSLTDREQLVWLYVKAMRQPSTKGAILNFAYASALAIGYAVLNYLSGQGGSPFGGGGPTEGGG